MSRNDDYVKILQSAALIHEHIAAILESKANEAEMAKTWTERMLGAAEFPGHQEQLKFTANYHALLIEVIDGMTKMEQALAKSMNIILGKEEEGSSDAGMGGGLFNFGGAGNDLFS